MKFQSFKNRARERGARIRRYFGVTTLLTWVVVSCILLASLLVGYHSLLRLYENKLRDTWAIMYLEMEQYGHTLSSQFKSTRAESKPPSQIFKLGEENKLLPISGKMTETIPINELGLDNLLFETSITVLQISGQPFAAEVAGPTRVRQMADIEVDSGLYLMLWEFPIVRWLSKPPLRVDDTIVYYLTREGRVLFATDPSVTSANVVKRPLVQMFIKNPLSRSQSEFDSGDGAKVFGFYREVPDSNIVMFAETPKAMALAPVKKIAVKGIMFLFLILITTGLILQWPLHVIVSPIRELAILAKEVASGNFAIAVKQGGFGEVAELSRSFEKMGADLFEREKTILNLMEHQKEKVRLENELEVVSSIQTNLLPRKDLPDNSGLVAAALYLPAKKCAGDWYYYHYDEAREATVVLIADVSGHGTAASMFTAVIAGAFVSLVNEESEFDVGRFVERVNRLIYKIGNRQWHATLVVAVHYASSEKIELTCCGHPWPYVVYPQGSLIKNEFIKAPSDVLGLLEEANFNTKVIPFPQGSAMFLYTDGLTEARNKRGHFFGTKRVKKICDGGVESPRMVIDTMQNQLNSFAGDAPAQDDVCMISLRAS